MGWRVGHGLPPLEPTSKALSLGFRVAPLPVGPGWRGRSLPMPSSPGAGHRLAETRSPTCDPVSDPQVWGFTFFLGGPCGGAGGEQVERSLSGQAAEPEDQPDL